VRLIRQIKIPAYFAIILFLGFLLFIQNPVTTSAQAQGSAAAESQNGAATTDSAQVGEFQKIENNWSEAVNQRDQYALELVLSPLFIDVSSKGEITTRNQQLAQAISNDDKTINLEQHVIAVRKLGDVVIANGTYTLHHKATSGPVDEKGVFTHVFQRTRGGWMCVNSQRTVLREEVSTKTKKQSDSESPLHIPFLHK
jgi:ketosteroid isomerase-like protein